MKTLEKYSIEMLKNGTLLVRIPSEPFQGKQMPDASFTFRKGDPQYEIWLRRYNDLLDNVSDRSH